MSLLAAFAPVLFLLALVAGAWIVRRLHPPPPRSPDAEGLRSVARFSHRGSDPAGLMDALASALEGSGFAVEPWVFSRDGCVLACSREGDRYRVVLELFGEVTLLVHGVIDELPYLVAPSASETTRALLERVDGVLREDPRVRRLRWLRREASALPREAPSERPFDERER